MLKYPGRSSSEKLLSYRDQEAVSGTWPELGLNRKADYKIGRDTESTAYRSSQGGHWGNKDSDASYQSNSL